MNAAVTAAAGLAGPIPGQVLPLTVAQYNGGTAGPIITSARTALGQARDQIKAAIAESGAVIATGALSAGRDADTSSKTATGF